MRFTETVLKGAYVIDIDPLEDERGFFARTWCKNEFERFGLDTNMSQCNISFNRKRGTLRGMHYQVPPHEEVKLVRCTMGAIYDVIVDLRPDSPTFRQWISENLTGTNRRLLYIPKGFAHGFQTLEDNTEIFYQISEPHEPNNLRGLRWDEPSVKIRWPLPISIISDRDLSYQLLKDI